MEHIATMEYTRFTGHQDILEYEILVQGEDTRIMDSSTHLISSHGRVERFLHLEAAFNAMSETHDEVAAYKGSFDRWYDDLLAHGTAQYVSYLEELGNETNRGR
jgi:hypothetical protein